ncbi:MAG: alanine--tRNA ligase [Actinobacteria bacterium]|nr:alanine--tRNA ligase [Actinomycetota bacterium]
MKPTTAAALREQFVEFFEARGHTRVPSASLIPHDPSLLLTAAGMVPFKPYMLGDEPAPYPRATSVQKCFRTTDIDIVGHTTRHCTFFEMLGNFSFGDYFKEAAIPYAWEFVTDVLGFPADKLWVTVYKDDDEAAEIWRTAVGVDSERIQRGEDDNFWTMGPTGPCGPCSEIFYDKGPEFGPDGGPIGGGEERFVEVWNLVFMQYDRGADGALTELPRKNIDTGAGLERILAVLGGQGSIFDTDELRQLVQSAETLTGRTYGVDETVDVSLRILAEHGRAATMLIGDGVFPSNEDRGYVLRRILRRLILHSYRLGVADGAATTLMTTSIDLMGSAYPSLESQRTFILSVASREEDRFRRTLQRGLDRLEELLAQTGATVSGDDAFFLHDTLGFPFDLTREIAAERGAEVDAEGFEALMLAQRERARAAQRGNDGADGAEVEALRSLVDSFGATEFTGYVADATDAVIIGVFDADAESASGDTPQAVDIYLDRTPFYAESGGQIGDTGVISSPDGSMVLDVVDTTYSLPGTLVRHRALIRSGTPTTGMAVTAVIDRDRRERIRRNHTGTHLLHWALREVLGDHVKQAGSYVGPDRLRFDFSHYEPVTSEDLAKIEALVNSEVLEDPAVETIEASRDDAETMGAVAFFGDKYGDQVRVLQAGPKSLEFCGGTHVRSLGQIGPVIVLSESSIGSNLRRIEAVTGFGALEWMAGERTIVADAAAQLQTTPTDVVDRIAALQGELKQVRGALRDTRAQQGAATARQVASDATDGIAAARVDGSTPDQLREMALAARDALGSGVAIFVGASEDGAKAGIAVAVSKDLQDRGLAASELAAPGARLLGGGTARRPDFVVGGGAQVGNLDAALDAVRAAALSATTP